MQPAMRQASKVSKRQQRRKTDAIVCDVCALNVQMSPGLDTLCHAKDHSAAQDTQCQNKGQTGARVAGRLPADCRVQQRQKRFRLLSNTAHICRWTLALAKKEAASVTAYRLRSAHTTCRAALLEVLPAVAATGSTLTFPSTSVAVGTGAADGDSSVATNVRSYLQYGQLECPSSHKLMHAS